jgi:hypothetical protein
MSSRSNQPAPAHDYEWQKDVAYALALGLDRPVDVMREGFGWRVLTGDLADKFWNAWRRDKAGMKAAGFKVRRSGEWLLALAPPTTEAAAKEVT